MTILPQLERDLFAAAERHLPARREPLHARLLVALSLAVGVAIAAVALVGLHQRGRPRLAPAFQSTASARAELIRDFGVLRTPQRKVELPPAAAVLGPLGLPGRPGARRWGYPELDRRLVRVVEVRAWKTRVYVLPTTFRPSRRSQHLTEGVNLAIGGSATGPRPATAGALLSRGLGISTAPAVNGKIRGVVLVPDGVARVELGPFRLAGPSPLGALDRKAVVAALAAVHADAAVARNLAAFEARAPTVTLKTHPPTIGGRVLGFGLAATARATWLDASGGVVRHTSTPFDIVLLIRYSTSHATRP